MIPHLEFSSELQRVLDAILTDLCPEAGLDILDPGSSLGAIGGIPRVLDAGQCNDSYSLVVIAQALAKVFGVGINEVPVPYNIAWNEQKAVLVLLALLFLGVKDITLGPKIPAFISPAVLDVLVREFDLKPNTTVQADLTRMIGA